NIELRRMLPAAMKASGSLRGSSRPVGSPLASLRLLEASRRLAAPLDASGCLLGCHDGLAADPCARPGAVPSTARLRFVLLRLRFVPWSLVSIRRRWGSMCSRTTAPICARSGAGLSRPTLNGRHDLGRPEPAFGQRLLRGRADCQELARPWPLGFWGRGLDRGRRRWRRLWYGLWFRRWRRGGSLGGCTVGGFLRTPLCGQGFLGGDLF